MDLQVAKWGNSLAVRLPASIVKRLKVKEGSALRAELMPDGTLALRPAEWSRAAFSEELRQAQAQLPMGSSVIEEMRRNARY